MPFQTYDEAVNWIVGLVNFGIKPGLIRMEAMMEKLVHPERRLKFIHVAGTNGKGSTCAYLTKVLHTCGYDVGTFTSPYITKFTNRIQYNGNDIPEEELLRLANQIKPIAEEIAATELGHPTMFEICTALAILYFAKVTYPDYVVWEVGLGGEFDSTNIVMPVISVITNIGHDHMEILGDSIEKVAAAKAGIIKPGVPVVSTVEQPEAIAVIEAMAKSKKSTLYLLNRDFNFVTDSTEENDQKFSFSGPFRPIPNVGISLNGPHQLKNAALAVMTLEVLRQYYALIVEDDDLYTAMKSTAWAGRLEMVCGQPRILIDGAHNPEGAEALATALKETYRYKRLHFMMGMLSTKNHTGYLRHILPIVDTIILTEPDFHKKCDAQQLAVTLSDLLQEMEKKPEVIVIPNWKDALDKLKSMTGPEDLAVVSGTLYLISDVRSWILNGSHSEKGW